MYRKKKKKRTNPVEKIVKEKRRKTSFRDGVTEGYTEPPRLGGEPLCPIIYCLW